MRCDEGEAFDDLHGAERGDERVDLYLGDERAVDQADQGTDTERGFSMALGRIGDPEDGDCFIATAHKTDEQPGEYGDLKAILHFVPWGTDGMSLDLMRRDRAADPGMNELLIVASLWYLATVSVLTMAQHALERHYGRGA